MNKLMNTKYVMIGGKSLSHYPVLYTVSLVRYVIGEFGLRDDELNEAYRRKHLWRILYSV